MLVHHRATIHLGGQRYCECKASRLEIPVSVRAQTAQSESNTLDIRLPRLVSSSIERGAKLKTVSKTLRKKDSCCVLYSYSCDIILTFHIGKWCEVKDHKGVLDA